MFQPLLSPSRRRLLAFLACTALALTYTAAQARPRSPEASGAALEVCMLSDDARFLENRTHFGCCSKDAGICVICPQPPSANNRCEVIAYRANIPGMNRAAPFDPELFNMQVQ